MGIFDLLKSLVPGLAGGDPTAAGPAAPAPAASPTATTSPDPMMSPAPEAAAPAAPAGGVSALLAPGQPSTPPTQDAGLGGFLQRMVHKATAQDPATGMSMVDKIGAIGGNMTDFSGSTRGAEQGFHDQGAARVTHQLAADRRAKLQQLADSMGMSPREKLVFTADPEAWTKANAERLGYHDQAAGTTGYYGEPGTPGSSSTTAPLIGQHDGEGFKVTPEGITDLGGLAMSPEQQSQALIKKAQDAATAEYHRIMAGAAVTRANKPALGNGGSWLPAGAKVVGQGKF